MDNVSLKQVLITARRLIQDVGFCKEKFFYLSNDGDKLAFCVLGAMMEAPKFIEYKIPNHIRYEGIRLLDEIVGCDISIWNDDPSRTKSDVLAVFDQAIASLSDDE